MPYTTPANVDGFSRYFAQAFNENNIIGVTTGFLSLFSRRRPIIRTDANVVNIDIVRGNEKTSKFILRGIVGEYLSNANTGTGKYTNFSRQFPIAEDEMAINVPQISDRMAGENPYSMRSRMERMRDIAREGYNTLMMRMVRLWERAAAESALTGKQSTILGTTDSNYIIDYMRHSDLIVNYASGVRWTTAGTTPIIDIDNKITTLNQRGKVSGQAGGDYVIVMGSDVVNGFFGNASVITAGDSRRIVTVQKNPDLVPPSQVRDMIAGGMTYLAFLSTNLGRRVHIMTYDAYYETDAGVLTPYMTAKSYLLMPISFRADRYFGPPDTLPMTSIDKAYLSETFGVTPASAIPATQLKASPGVIFPQAFYVDAYPGGNRKSATLRLQSAPIFATTQTDALLTGNTVVA